MSTNEIINVLRSENASGITHLIKQFGGGSMKKGLTVLFEKAAENDELKKALAKAVAKSNKQNIVIGALGTAVLGLATYIYTEKRKKCNAIQNNEESVLAAATEELQEMTEEEVEAVVVQALEQEENQNG
ncbi:MAG: hypothetical protein Q4B60_05415 [Erysipelotrichaceae bacterium]|nr:hypothetical protein [Erysipelotrichaceae bacterium]